MEDSNKQDNNVKIQWHENVKIKNPKLKEIEGDIEWLNAQSNFKVTKSK